MTKPQNKTDKKSTGLTVAGAVAVVILVGFLGWAGWYSVTAWNAMGDVHMSVAGWIFLTMGVVFTFAVGAGLMALVFYSSRHDLDR